jgi:hypothetical protein
VQVSLASAEAGLDRIELTWFAGEGGFPATLERSAGEAWSALALLSADGNGYFRYVDRDVEPGHRYGYRLRVDGAATPLGEVWLEVPVDLRLSVGGLRPNPATRGAAVYFTLPRRAPARLELIDVTGRRVLAREVGGLGMGSHLLRLDENERIPSGLYFIRLTQGSLSITTRGVIMH